MRKCIQQCRPRWLLNNNSISSSNSTIHSSSRHRINMQTIRITAALKERTRPRTDRIRTPTTGISTGSTRATTITPTTTSDDDGGYERRCRYETRDWVGVRIVVDSGGGVVEQQVKGHFIYILINLYI